MSYEEFNAMDLINEQVNDGSVPIVILLENDNSTLITFVTTFFKDPKYFRLDTDIGYNILTKDYLLYLQNEENCFLLQEDGTLQKLPELLSEYEMISPIPPNKFEGYCYAYDCSIKETDEAYKENYDLAFSKDLFDYRDYKLVSFVRLCDYPNLRSKF